MKTLARGNRAIRLGFCLSGGGNTLCVGGELKLTAQPIAEAAKKERALQFLGELPSRLKELLPRVTSEIFGLALH